MIAVYNKKSEAMSNLLHGWVQALNDSRQFVEARRLALELVALEENLHGRGQEYAEAMLLLGDIAREEGDFSQALEYYEEAEPLMKPATAETL